MSTPPPIPTGPAIRVAPSVSPLTIHVGPKALAQLRRHGLRAQDIAVVPAAAGGPKGLIFQKLDQWLFGQWLPSAPRERSLIGASIGAWRMAAACHDDPVAAFQRMGDLYVAQHYPRKPTAQHVTDCCRQLLTDFIGGHAQEVAAHPHFRLHMLTARGHGLLQTAHGLPVRAGFGIAILGNLVSRSRLAPHLRRVVIGDARDALAWLKTPFDAFDTRFVPLSTANLGDALLASGTLPFIMEAVRGIPGAPAGMYWDGGLIDYHLALPYARVAQQAKSDLVLYPHFSPQIVPGWFDKPMRWRRAASGAMRPWLDNVILVSPSPAFLQTLPRRRLPDRRDFAQYGSDNELRMRHWRSAIGEGERLRDAFAAFVDKPNLDAVQAIY
jgi:hypothetical protein